MKTKLFFPSLILLTALTLVGCGPRARVGALQTETRTVELDGAESVRVEIILGAGDLTVSGGAENLLDAHFTYNVAVLKPQVTFTDGILVVRQPNTEGLPNLQNITDFRNEWNLNLNDDMPMNMSINMGAGNSSMQLAGLSLTGLDVSLGAGTSTLDLNGDWTQDVDITVDSGAADIIVRLPKNVGVRVEVDRGPTAIYASGLTQNDNVYVNAAYGTSEATLDIKIEAGVGLIRLEVEE
ncbi:MAG: toast rack family protein [Anaerolineales bacterium]|nr:MAG: toast rack family protein [Anaerolineales bacterium]